jgi:D-amino-acid dehydrogenase
MRVVVIGGGVIGLACAYELRKRGADVAVLDARQMGAAASWGNAGWIVPSLSGPVPEPGLTLTALRWLFKPDSPLYIRHRPDPEFVRWMWSFWRHCNARDYQAGFDAMAALNRRTMERYDSWQAEGVEFEMHAQGLLFAFVTQDGLRKHLEEHAHLEAYGYAPPAPRSGDEIRAAEPILSTHVVGGFLIERDRHVMPASLTAGLSRRLEDTGADLRPGAAVSGFRRAPEGAHEQVVAVDTPSGPVEADVFVLAAGAWSARLARMAGFRLPVESGKGYSITIEHPATQLRQPLYLGEAKVGVSPYDGALRFAGTMELSGLSEDIHAKRLDAIRRSISRFLVSWPQGERDIPWAGMRPLTPDGLPAIGRAPGLENLFVATGHSMLGITLAPATGAAVAELICTGRSEVDVRAFDPGRFAN